MRTHTTNGRWLLLRALAMSLALAGLLWGCHADENDPAGQAGELTDSVRRENAITNIARIYHAALDRASGDRTNADVQHVVDVTITQLNQCYLDHSEDVNGRTAIIALLADMRDPRGLPALIAALDWRAEISEDSATTAANALENITMNDEQRGQAIAGIGAALGRVTTARGTDNRMRQAFLETLGAFHDPRATEAVSRVVLLQSENQPFLINRLACQQLALIADPASVPTLIRALYLFDTNNPAMRMNDVASMALVNIGRPALQPLIDTLQGHNTEANAIATQYIAAVRSRDADAAAQMAPDSIIAGDAAFALGQLGFREAIDPLIAETQRTAEGERPGAIEENSIVEQHMTGAALALVSINRDESDSQRIRDALQAVYNRLNPEPRMGHVSRAQLLVAFQHLDDAGMMPFLLQRAQPPARGQDADNDVRVLAFRAYLLMANETEIANLERILTAEPEGSARDGFLDATGDLDSGAPADAARPVMAATHECNQDIACWARKLTDHDSWVSRKACYMLARFGRGNADAVTALVGQLGTSNEELRGEVLYALDYAATSGSAPAVARISELQRTESGRAIWNHTQSLALAVQARLASRAAH
jgi:HEAT repeat protein